MQGSLAHQLVIVEETVSAPISSAAASSATDSARAAEQESARDGKKLSWTIIIIAAVVTAAVGLIAAGLVVVSCRKSRAQREAKQMAVIQRSRTSEASTARSPARSSGQRAPSPPRLPNSQQGQHANPMFYGRQ